MSISDYKLVGSISSGASPVLKYVLKKDNKLYLLRLYNTDFFQSRINAFNNMKLLSQKGIKVPQVMEYSELSHEKYSYAIIEYIEGTPLDKILTPENEEFYGELVGKRLRDFHKVSTKPINVQDKYLRSIEKKIKRITDQKTDINLDELIKYIDQNKQYLEGTTSSIIHGDFHPGNLILSEDDIYFIDLDVCKENHPYSDLSSNADNNEYRKFYSSLINSYFDNSPPEDFWRIYNLYGIMYLLDYILYSKREGIPLSIAEEKIEEFLKNNNHFSTEPTWYKVKRKEN